MADNRVWIVEDATYRTENGKPVILLFSRNYHNKFETVTHFVHNFSPYFYVPENETEVALPPGCYYEGHPIEDALGRKVIKVVVNHPSVVPQIRDQWSFTDMADFLFEKRFLVDYKIKYAYTWNEDIGRPIPTEVPSILEPRIIFYDIEVLAPTGIMPLPKDSDYPVISIQVMDNYTEKIIVFTTSKVQQQDDKEHIVCGSEVELFKIFLAYISKLNPDILTAWNGSLYDLPYLIRRSWKLNININKLARHGKCQCEYEPETNTFNTRVKGRATLDMLEAYKKYYIMRGQRESYSLKAVSADYGFEYVDYGPVLDRVINEDKDYKTFIQYCKNDVISLDNINKQTSLFTFYELLRSIVGTRIDDVLYNSRLIEMYLLREDIKPMPTKRSMPENTDKFEGALVLLPPPGIHENVATVDLAALYPTIMRAFPKETCPDIDLKIIEVLELIVNKREEMRSQRLSGNKDPSVKTREEIYKTLANSFYGVCGAPTFRLYKRECAENVTSRGRQINIHIHETLKGYGYSVLYSDTDSSFFSEIKTVEEGLRIQDALNHELENWGSSQGALVVFKLKFEKLYRRILFKKASSSEEASKKKYVGHLIWEEGEVMNELNYKGIELKRSDNSQFTKDMLREFFEIVLIQNDIPKASQFIRTSYDNVKNGNVDIMDITIPKAIRKVTNTDNPWKRGIENTKKIFNYNIPDGVKPRLLYVKREPYEICIDDELDIGEWKDYIDWDEILEKTVTKKLKSYAESAGISWARFIHNQQSLSQWF